MARQNPVSEIDRQIGQRLRQYRIEKMGISAVEFARRIGIDSNRFATYEHGRAPIRFEVAEKIAITFDLSLRWLAEGVEPARYYLSISKSLRDTIPPRSIFSNVYNGILKPHIDKHFAELANLWQGNLDGEFLETVQELGQNTIAPIESLDVLNYLNRRFVQAVDEIPPDLYQPFYTEIVKACQQFQKGNSKRIEEWKKTPKSNTPPAWVAQNEKTTLTDSATCDNNQDVPPQLPSLLERLNRATSQSGKMSALAASLGVPLASVSRWLAGKREPGGEITLKLLKWVEQQERQK